MAYYHELVTQKSWQELQRLKKNHDFILIGGWAVYLYTKTLKSKDIDIIVDFDQLPALEKEYQVTKNDRLKKYQALKDEIEIDMYLPHYSQIGIPVADLVKQAQVVAGFTVLKPNYLIALKFFTLKQRGHSVKGQKDFIDIISLLRAEKLDWKEIKTLVTQYTLASSIENFKETLDTYYEVPELNLNKHTFARLKKRIVTGLN